MATDYTQDANCEAAYLCDDASGNTVTDYSTNGSNGSYADGLWGNASLPKAYMTSYLDFDGADGVVDCGDAAGTDFIADTTDFTITFWCVDYTLGNTNERYITRESSGTGDGWQLVRGADGGALLVVEISGTQYGFWLTNLSTTLQDGKHYAVEYDWSTNRVSVYIDGVLTRNNVSNDLTNPGFGWATADTLFIGARGATASTQCESHLNEIGLFSRLLTITEIQDIYNYGLTGQQPDIIKFFTGVSP